MKFLSDKCLLVTFGSNTLNSRTTRKTIMDDQAIIVASIIYRSGTKTIAIFLSNEPYKMTFLPDERLLINWLSMLIRLLIDWIFTEWISNFRLVSTNWRTISDTAKNDDVWHLQRVISNDEHRSDKTDSLNKNLTENDISMDDHDCYFSRMMTRIDPENEHWHTKINWSQISSTDLQTTNDTSKNDDVWHFQKVMSYDAHRSEDAKTNNSLKT